jgi:hypothetical protein
MIRHILIRTNGATCGGDVVQRDARDLVALYSTAELSRLAIGLTVKRDTVTHVDLLAFHDRNATPDRHGSVFLRTALKRVGLAA